MTDKINSEATCRKIYLNAHCYENSLGTSASDMGKITQAWSDKVPSWQNTVSSDENEYEFKDNEYSSCKKEGKDAAKETTGHNGKKENIVRVAGEAASGLAGAAGNLVGKKVTNKLANKAVEKVAGKATSEIVEEAAKKAGEKAAEKAGEEAGKKAAEKVTTAGKNVGWIITAPLALATGTAYMANKPNKDQKEACDALQTEMNGAMATLADSQSEMETMSEEIITLSDEATMKTEETNEAIEEQKTEYDMYQKSLLELKSRADSGEKLTESEKALYKESMDSMTAASGLIGDLAEDSTDEVDTIQEEIGTYQEGYDVAAETIGEIEGLTDFAEGFDKATQTMCYVEAAAQGLNAYSGGKAALQAGKFAASGGIFTAWAWGFAAAGGAGAAMSIAGTSQQTNWAGEVGTEIELRKATQDINTETLDIYTEEIDAYDGFMDGVEELEPLIPKDIEAPEGFELKEEKEPTGKDAVPENLRPENNKKPKIKENTNEQR